MLSLITSLITLQEVFMTTLTGQVIALTGKFTQIKRKDAGLALEALGAKIASGVSAKTTLLIAGTDAGSKLYQAHERSIPILNEPHLQLLLAGQALDEVLDLATSFSTLELHRGEPELPPLNIRGGAPAGVGSERWPEDARGPLDHLLTLNLNDLPNLKLYFGSEARTLSLFSRLKPTSDSYLSMDDMSRPSRWIS
jgi:hypothetical protein